MRRQPASSSRRGEMARTLPSPLSSSPEENLAVGKCPRDRQHLFQSPVFTNDGLRMKAGMGCVGDSSVRLHSRVSGGGSAQQGRQEVKIAPAYRPSMPCPRPGPGLGSRNYSGAWESYIPWRKAPSQSPPPPFPLQGRWPLWVPAQQAEEGREGRGWRRKEAEACAEVEACSEPVLR